MGYEPARRVRILKAIEPITFFSAGILRGTDAVALPLRYSDIVVTATDETVEIKLIATPRDGRLKGAVTVQCGKTMAGRANQAGGIYAYWTTPQAPLIVHLTEDDFLEGSPAELLMLQTTQIINVH